MPETTRRQFLRNASLGAAAAGVVAAGGAGILSALSSSGSVPSAHPGGPADPELAGSDVFAHVADAQAGRITIFVGTKAISYTNRDLAQQLMRAAQ